MILARLKKLPKQTTIIINIQICAQTMAQQYESLGPNRIKVAQEQTLASFAVKMALQRCQMRLFVATIFIKKEIQ